MFRKIFAILLMLMALTFFPSPFPVMGSLATVSIEPRITKVWGVEETFNINISVADVENLYGWETKLYFYSSILEALNVSEGFFLNRFGGTFFNFTVRNNYNATHGCIEAFNTLLGEIPGVNGTGVLLAVTFKTKELGISPLYLKDVILSDINGNSIPCTTIDGGVEVVSVVHDVAVKSISVSSDVVVEGRLVEIQVTTENLGNKTESFNVTVYYNETLIAEQEVNMLSPQTAVDLVFLWNTTSITPNATCIIKAEASQVQGETRLENNVLIYGTVEVVQGVHDVAVVTVRPASQAVYEGETLNIYVTVANRGNYTETFNVTLYIDDAIIDVQTVEKLLYDSTLELTFLWDTGGVPSGTYTLRASADPVKEETRLEDNTLTDGNVTVHPYTELSIRIIEVVPCDQLGRPVSGFAAGTVANFKVTLNCTLVGAKEILLTINVYDAGVTTIGVVSFQGPVASGITTFILGLPIPTTASVGNARVYASALSDWPHLGGTPYCPEASSTFEIRR